MQHSTAKIFCTDYMVILFSNRLQSRHDKAGFDIKKTHGFPFVSISA